MPLFYPQTEPIVRTASAPGPTVLVIARLDSTQPAGRGVLEQARDWPLLRGRLVLMMEGAGFSAALDRFRPDWVVELRESLGAKATTLQAGNVSKAREMVEALSLAVDIGVGGKVARFALDPMPLAPGSPAAEAESRGAAVMVVCTRSAGKGQPISRRVRQGRQVVHALLNRLGMVDAALPTLTGEDAAGKLRIAMYDSDGVGGAGPKNMEAVLSAHPEVVFRRVGTTEIKQGILAQQFDILLYPGGAGGTMGRALGKDGREKVRTFLYNGGGYVGVCAGAYLSSRTYGWSLHILSAQVLDREHWVRGRATLRLEVTPAGREILGDDYPTPIRCVYHNGPILSLLSPAQGQTAATPLVVFREERVGKGGKKGIMLGAPAIAAGEFGKGRVAVVSPHPEQTPGLEKMVPRLIAWCAHRDPLD